MLNRLMMFKVAMVPRQKDPCHVTSTADRQVQTLLSLPTARVTPSRFK